MKRIVTILPLLSLIVLGCNREPHAEAEVSYNPAYVGELIRFTSYSTNTDYVEWDMDDGFMYTDPIVDHYFVDPGWYDVQLRAFGTKGGVSTAVIPMEVIGAELKVVVSLWTDEDNGAAPGYLLPGANVRLYPTLNDWNNETNLVAEAFTDSYGECYFTNLSYQNYFVDVWEANHDNYTLAAESVDWIMTEMLDGSYNWTFDAKVDYYPNGKKSAVSGERAAKTVKAASADQKRSPSGIITKVPRERK